MKILKTIAIKMIALSTISILAGYSSLANADNSQNRYRVGGIVGFGFILKDLQDFLPEEPSPASSFGASFTFDWFGGAARQHSLAFDLHGISRNHESSPRVTSSTSANSLYLGYRYHTPAGFFIGLGATLLNDITNARVESIRETDEDGRVSEGIALGISRVGRAAGIPLGFNLGYVKTYNNGFSIGFNALQTTAVPIEYEGGGQTANNAFAINTVGLVLAFTKRDK